MDDRVDDSSELLTRELIRTTRRVFAQIAVESGSPSTSKHEASHLSPVTQLESDSSSKSSTSSGYYTGSDPVEPQSEEGGSSESDIITEHTMPRSAMDVTCGQSDSGNMQECQDLPNYPLGIRPLPASLAQVNQDWLRHFVQPIQRSLESIDAINLLNLRPVAATHLRPAVRLKEDVYVEPIHNRIEPTKECAAVRYLHVSELEGEYSIGIFVFLPNATIPLHDHPGMCVLSRVLYGELYLKSYDVLTQEERDVVEPPKNTLSYAWKNWRKPAVPTPGSKLARQRPLQTLRAPYVTTLFPYEGNAHEFTAGPNGAAVLDVLLPPYDFHHDRDCTFYQWDKDKKLLVPMPQPKKFHCISGSYGHFGNTDDDGDDDELST